MSEYTPTLFEVREAYVHSTADNWEGEREFDRWLQQERAEAWAEAYKQGFQAGAKTGDTHYIADNPYLKEEEK